MATPPTPPEDAPPEPEIARRLERIRQARRLAIVLGSAFAAVLVVTLRSCS